MTLGPEIDATLPELREQAESLMRDTCRITRDGAGEPVFNPETGEYERPGRVVVYGPEIEPHRGKCRLQDNRVQVSSNLESSQAGAVILAQNVEIQLPVDGTDHIATGDVAEMLTCTNDPAVVGRKLTVEGLHHKTHATSRRLRVKEATGG